MKKSLYILAAALTIITACKKNEDSDPEPETPVAASDTTKPVLTLNGNKNDTALLQSNYPDLGATALDNKDGDISPFIVVSGTVNTNLKGDYVKNYDVRDVAGNASKVTRNIYVKNQIEYLEGSYAVACSCSTINPGAITQTKNITYTASVVASASLNTYFNISQLDVGRQGLAPSTNLSSDGTTIIGINSPGMLSGSLSVSKTSFTLSSTSYDQMNISQMRQCTNVFTKQ